MYVSTQTGIPKNCSIVNKTEKINETNSKEKAEKYWQHFLVKPELQQFFLPTRVLDLKNKILTALYNNRVFMISGSRSIRKALLTRGWIEKKFNQKRECEYLEPNQVYNKVEEAFAEYRLHLVDNTNEAFDALDAKMCEMILESVIPNFCWNCLPNTKNHEIPRNTVVNRLGSKFTNKEILSHNLTELSRGNSCMINVQFPRCYASCDVEQFADFTENFRLTSSMSLLKFFLFKNDNEGLDSICCDTGEVNINNIEFAVTRLVEYVQFKRHEDLDISTEELDENKWCEFLECSYRVVHKNAKLRLKTKSHALNLIEVCRQILQTVEMYWPQYQLDGMYNIWLLKPGNGSRGRNIHITSNYSDVLNYIQRVGKVYRWVIQKYVENPLLIYNTKFDIRVWFILKTAPLEIWIYKDCYLRFCSRSFELLNFHESIHLANYCIQRKYKNQFVHSELPENNMWHSNTFQSYLNMYGFSSKWNQIIYPGITQCITGAILSVEANIRPRHNAFQLYGADFILDEKCCPWLMEINSSPDTAHTTIITASLVPKCMEDIIKVTVDLRSNPKASTGRFACVFHENVIHHEIFSNANTSNLIVIGKRIKRKTDEYINDVYSEQGVVIKASKPLTSYQRYRPPLYNNNSSKNDINIPTTVILHRVKNTIQFKDNKMIEKPDSKKSNRPNSKQLTNKNDNDSELPANKVSSFEFGLMKNQLLAEKCMIQYEKCMLQYENSLKLPSIADNNGGKPNSVDKKDDDKKDKSDDGSIDKKDNMDDKNVNAKINLNTNDLECEVSDKNQMKKIFNLYINPKFEINPNILKVKKEKNVKPKITPMKEDLEIPLHKCTSKISLNNVKSIFNEKIKPAVINVSESVNVSRDSKGSNTSGKSLFSSRGKRFSSNLSNRSKQTSAERNVKSICNKTTLELENSTVAEINDRDNAINKIIKEHEEDFKIDEQVDVTSTPLDIIHLYPSPTITKCESQNVSTSDKFHIIDNSDGDFCIINNENELNDSVQNGIFDAMLNKEKYTASAPHCYLPKSNQMAVHNYRQRLLSRFSSVNRPTTPDERKMRIENLTFIGEETQHPTKVQSNRMKSSIWERMKSQEKNNCAKNSGKQSLYSLNSTFKPYADIIRI